MFDYRLALGPIGFLIPGENGKTILEEQFDKLDHSVKNATPAEKVLAGLLCPALIPTLVNGGLTPKPPKTVFGQSEFAA